ncbi:SMC-Scp complex subunit ScpB [bacterium]|nr:SMC-Scp complex subunit ScpB [bacterium]
MAENTLDNLTQIVEAIIFASDEPITYEQLRITIEETSVKQVKTAVNELNHAYSQSDRTFHIVEVAGGVQMVTRSIYAQWLKRLFQRKAKSRLSHAALETLSVIAFKQPIAKSDVAGIRGVSCDGVVKTLLERDLVAIGGRADGPGRPLLYKTTKEFLRYFGINSIKDLPKPREIEELLQEDKPDGAEQETTSLFPLGDTVQDHTISSNGDQADPVASDVVDNIDKNKKEAINAVE